MMRTIVVVSFAISGTHAFAGVKPVRATLQSAIKMNPQDLTFNPLEGYQGVDLERARHCADNFGACSVEEMEFLKQNLHKERVQNFSTGGSAMTKPNEDGLEHLLLEEELELQLEMLKDQTPDTTLFPEDADEMAALPHLKDKNPDIEEHNEGFFHKPTPSELLYLEEEVVEENLLEPVLMCMVIAGLMFLPQFFN